MCFAEHCILGAATMTQQPEKVHIIRCAAAITSTPLAIQACRSVVAGGADLRFHKVGLRPKANQGFPPFTIDDESMCSFVTGVPLCHPPSPSNTSKSHRAISVVLATTSSQFRQIPSHSLTGFSNGTDNGTNSLKSLSVKLIGHLYGLTFVLACLDIISKRPREPQSREVTLAHQAKIYRYLQDCRESGCRHRSQSDLMHILSGLLCLQDVVVLFFDRAITQIRAMSIVMCCC